MAQQRKRVNKGKKRKGKIKFKQTARLVEKNDATRVSRYNDTIPKIARRIPQDNGVTFKIKVRRK